jgi:hypothetical protein
MVFNKTIKIVYTKIRNENSVDKISTYKCEP